MALGGDVVVAGSANDDEIDVDAGAAYVFARTGVARTFQRKLTVPDATLGDAVGTAVAVSGDTALVGAPGEDDAGNAAGAAYAFDGLAGPPAIASFILPKTVIAKFDAGAPAKSKLVVAGILDTGPGAPDLASANVIDVGGIHVEVPGLSAVGGQFRFSGQGLEVQVEPNPYCSSRAKFNLSFTGDLSGRVARDGPLAIRFEDAAAAGGCRVNLADGRFGLGDVAGSLVEPDLFVVRASAAIKGAGKDSLSVIVGIATNGVVPASASKVSIAFGDVLFAEIPASGFVRKGAVFRFSGNESGVTDVTLDYARETMEITAKGLTLSGFVQGANPVVITVGLGADTRSVAVRMGRVGKTMKY